jgi:iron complex transport system permease protein
MRFTDSSAIFDSMTFLERNIQQALVLGGCLGVVLLVVGVTTFIGRGKIRTVDLIMSGVILNSLIGTLTGVVQYAILASNPYDIRVQIIRNLTMGSLDRAFTTEHMLTMCAFLIPCAVIMLLLANRMNILSHGEEEARTMGVNTRTFRIVVIGLNTVTMAVVLSFCGNIGFLGFIAPLAARRLVGPNFRRLLPASMILGALVLLVVYNAAQQFGLASYLNLLTSGFGSVLMIIAFLKGKGALDAA